MIYLFSSTNLHYYIKDLLIYRVYFSINDYNIHTYGYYSPSYRYDVNTRKLHRMNTTETSFIDIHHRKNNIIYFIVYNIEKYIDKIIFEKL